SVTFMSAAPSGWLDQGRPNLPWVVLADFLHRFIERRPFFFQTFILDLAQLGVGDFKPFGDDLIRPADARSEVLGRYQVTENVATLLQRQAFRSHEYTPPTSGDFYYLPGRARLRDPVGQANASVATRVGGLQTACSPFSSTPPQREGWGRRRRR